MFDQLLKMTVWMWPHGGLERLKSCAKAQPRCRPHLLKTEIVIFNQANPDHCFALSQQSLAYMLLPNQTKLRLACISQSCHLCLSKLKFDQNIEACRTFWLYSWTDMWVLLGHQFPLWQFIAGYKKVPTVFLCTNIVMIELLIELKHSVKYWKWRPFFCI